MEDNLCVYILQTHTTIKYLCFDIVDFFCLTKVPEWDVLPIRLTAITIRGCDSVLVQNGSIEHSRCVMCHVPCAMCHVSCAIAVCVSWEGECI